MCIRDSLHNLLVVSEAITRSALVRRESRGAHSRLDHPDKDADQGRVNTVVRRDEGGGMTVAQVDLPEIRDDLKQIIEENQ